MNNLATLNSGQLARYSAQHYRKSLAAHTRALKAPMHSIPFVGEAAGTSTVLTSYGNKCGPYAAMQRRSILWATWKGKATNQLPDDVSGFDAHMADGKVTFTPRHNKGWQTVTIDLPDWQEAGEIVEITLDAAHIETLPAPCTDTKMIEFAAPAPVARPAKTRKTKQRYHMIFLNGGYQTVPYQDVAQ